MAFIPNTKFAFAVVVWLAVGIRLYQKLYTGSKLPLPPGPPREPVLGHLRIIPQSHPEYQYTEWGKEYKSDVLYFDILGRPIVVLNSVEACHDLLDKRGSNYNDRPRFVLFEVMGWGITLTFLRWGKTFKLHRKLMQASFTQSACKAYRPIQEQEARQAAKHILASPEDWDSLLRKFSTAVVLRIGFGLGITQRHDPYIQMAIDAEEATGKGGVPGASVVDFFPMLRYLPGWLFRLGALEHARSSKVYIQKLHDAPWNATEPAIRSGHATLPSFMRTHLERYVNNEKHQKVNEATIADIKGAAGAISIAGGNTTWSTLMVCILNLVLHPAIQKKAQEQIDSVVGTDRLPSFEDREKMPYIEYIIQETTRWYPLSPLGVPHATLEDDMYKGMFIPKGSVVFANAYAMTHDERVYRHPDVFDPDRYVPEDQGGRGEPFPEGPFGFGRRVCPGQWLATAGVYIMLTTLLATTDICCPKDDQGKELPPKVMFTNGLSK
ncbi:cytochrome P450 [Exophiala viscosa]|uniref:cytochrome P450 n=1 Tax=Exophiala viscosa TaxID=2486360 RepID=UPI002194EEB7|nr:cytochrome P450 [Exophiala viscosa]